MGEPCRCPWGVEAAPSLFMATGALRLGTWEREMERVVCVYWCGFVTQRVYIWWCRWGEGAGVVRGMQAAAGLFMATG